MAADRTGPRALSESHFHLRTPRDFNFWRTALSHGWAVLPPFHCDEERKTLDRVLRLADGALFHCRLSAVRDGIVVDTQSRNLLTSRQRAEASSLLRTCLRLDEDYTEFYAAARNHPEFRWIPRAGAGRLLRAPTVFEDAVKMICTTNCTWALTTLMVTNLVGHAGTQLSDEAVDFPRPDAVAALTERTMRSVVKAGYRSPYILELAERVASGKLDIESWRTSLLPSEELGRQMLGVKGIGRYAAGNLMKLVGRYDELGLDSWVRTQFFKLHRNGRRVKDSTIERHYRDYGKWRGLFFWLEMTKEWH